MGRINLSDAGKYTQSGSEYFVLADDGDTARVRLLYDDPTGADFDFYLVHEVDIGGKKRYVSCNAVDEEGRLHPDDCPLCKAGNRPKEKLFIQLYDEDAGVVKLWERGKNFVPKIVSYLNRYGSLVSQAFDIERRGKKGDTNTSYELYALERDNKTLEDFPEKQQLEGGFIIKASVQDMHDMVDGIYQIEQVGNNGMEEPPQQVNRRERNRDTSRSRTRQRVTQDAF